MGALVAVVIAGGAAAAAVYYFKPGAPTFNANLGEGGPGKPAGFNF